MTLFALYAEDPDCQVQSCAVLLGMDGRGFNWCLGSGELATARAVSWEEVYGDLLFEIVSFIIAVYS